MVRPNRTAPIRRLGVRARLMTVAVASCYASAPAWALNAGDLNKIVGGFSASQSGNVDVLTLTTASSRTLVEAQKRFNVLAHEKLNIIQPTAGSLFMLRVVPQSGALERSVIDGSIYSNGQFWLQNAAGVLIGKGAAIDTAGFLATNMAVRHEDFLAGRLSTLGTPGVGSVENKGTIKTGSGGSVYLIGANVSNEGVITTPGGETILAAGQTVNLIDTGTPGVKVEVTGEQGNVTNLGEIVATAGRIGMAGVIVKNAGTLNASSVVNEGGRVFLKASKDTYVDGAGRIVATGTKGGRVEVLGNRVAVMDQASIDVSGTHGGGSVLVGGDYQGNNSDVQNATISYFGPQAGIKADAIADGNGGKVIIWADDTTRAYGRISARGGANGGNGGVVETSGYRYLDVAGARVDTRAPRGKVGNWLLDPMDIAIVSGAYGGPIPGGGVFAPSGGATSTLTDADINAHLATSGLTIQTDGAGSGSGNITVTNANISSTYSLTLLAYGGMGGTGDITVSGSSFNLSGGDLRLVAGWSGSGWNVIDGTGNVTVTQSSAQAMNLDFRAGGNISIAAGSTGTLLSAGMTTNMSGRSIYATGGAVSNHTSQGPGVFVYGGSGMTLWANETDGEILLQGGTANNAVYGGQYSYGGSVMFQSGGSQTVRAHKLRVIGGASGHDNAAALEAYGSQFITVYGGGLLVQGGGSTGSYNNAARISQRLAAGTQSITVFGGGSVTLYGGSGTGTGGYYQTECGSPCAGASSNNMAEIENKGSGGQTIDFIAGGAVALYGGAAGTHNDASIDNESSATQKIWSSTLNSVNYPTLYVQGGTGGTVVFGGGSYGGTGIDRYFDLENGAGISSGKNGVPGSQIIYAKGITLIGGGNAASVGGAYLGVDGGGTQTIVSYGGVTLTGGAGNAVVGENFTAPAAIGSEDDANILMAIYGGNLTLTGGSGTGSPVLIGSLHYGANIAIGVYGGDVTMTGGTGGVAVGSYRKPGAAGTPIDTSVRIKTAGNLSASGNVRIGAFDAQLAAIGVELFAGKNLMLSGVKVGTDGSPGTSTLDIKAGIAGSGLGSVDGGDLSLVGTTVYGSNVTLQAYGGSTAAGNLVIDANSRVYGGGVNLVATGNVDLNGLVRAANILGVGAGFYETAFTSKSVNGGNISMGTSAVAYGGTSLSFRASAGSSLNANAGRIGLNRLESPSIQVYADHQIFDNNGTGVANAAGQSISLNSMYGGTSDTLAVSADVEVSGPTSIISASVNPAAAYGGISVRNVGAAAPSSLTMSDQSTAAGYGNIYYSSLGNIDTSTMGLTLSSSNGGIVIQSAGTVTIGNLSMVTPGTNNAAYRYLGIWGQYGLSTAAAVSLSGTPDLFLGTAGPMTIAHGIAGANNLGLYSSGAMNVTGANLTSVNDIGLWSDSGINLSGSTVTANNGNAYLGSAALVFDAAGGGSYSGAGGISLVGSSVRAPNSGTIGTGNIYAYTNGDIRLNSGSKLEAGSDVYLDLAGSGSTLYLNDIAGYAASYVVAGTPNSINLDFPARSADGVVIDGVTTDTSVAGGSGLFVGSTATPAVKGAGLNIVYGVAPVAVTTAVINTIVSTTNTTPTSDSSPSSTTTQVASLPPSTTSTTSSLTSLEGQTVGGTAGTFGETSTTATTTSGTTTSGTTTTDSTSSTSTTTSGTATSGESQAAAGSGEASGSKDAKEEKKDDKKDDKAKKADSSEKKDDKSSKKPVGKCSA